MPESQPDSPCINVCRIDPRSGLCVGCRRSLREITDWPAYTAEQKATLLARLPDRHLAPG
jgi:predicted Fe-S protein YdhL (DUF1289 family)